MGVFEGGPRILKPLDIKPRYKITVIILTKNGQANHYQITLPDTEGFFKQGETNYIITKAGLYERKRFVVLRPMFETAKIRFYWILFNEGKPNHVKPQTPIVKGSDLWVMSNSRILKKALAEQLKSRGIPSKLLLVLLFVSIVIIYYLLTGGKIVL